jgi:hypothetical protein
VSEIARTIFAAMGRDLDLVTFPGPPRGSVGDTPWSVARPLILSMDAAKAELGYQQPVSYTEAVADEVEWIVNAVAVGDNNERSWQDIFPELGKRAAADKWFDYEAEDQYLAWLR